MNLKRLAIVLASVALACLVIYAALRLASPAAARDEGALDCNDAAVQARIKQYWKKKDVMFVKADAFKRSEQHVNEDGAPVCRMWATDRKRATDWVPVDFEMEKRNKEWVVQSWRPYRDG